MRNYTHHDGRTAAWGMRPFVLIGPGRLSYYAFSDAQWADRRAERAALRTDPFYCGTIAQKGEHVEVRAPATVDPFTWVRCGLRAALESDAAAQVCRAWFLEVTEPACRANLMLELLADPHGPALAVEVGRWHWLLFGSAFKLTEQNDERNER